MISVIIPSRNERFLLDTVEDLLEKAREEIEVIPVLDGPHGDLSLPKDPRVRVLQHERPTGMRTCINDGVAVANGEFLMKCDAHCIFAYDFDFMLKKFCEEHWLVIPRRYSIDGDNWVVNGSRSPVDYEHFNYPRYRPPHIGLYTVPWNQRRDKRFGSNRCKIDDNMAFQGSCWFTTAEHFRTVIGRLDEEYFGMWAGEPQEMGLKTWLSGGRVVVNKYTWYAHLHKGKMWKSYSKNRTDIRVGMARVVDYWMNNKWEGRKYDIEWLVNKFWPVPTWPKDWREQLQQNPIPSWEEVLRINRG
jgi:glycosyltransferase involved in cell wall biosynthesis